MGYWKVRLSCINSALKYNPGFCCSLHPSYSQIAGSGSVKAHAFSPQHSNPIHAPIDLSSRLIKNLCSPDWFSPPTPSTVSFTIEILLGASTATIYAAENADWAGTAESVTRQIATYSPILYAHLVATFPSAVPGVNVAFCGSRSFLQIHRNPKKSVGIRFGTARYCAS